MSEAVGLRLHLVDPSDVSFGIGVITPRWLYVIAAATPALYGDPAISDQTLGRHMCANTRIATDSARRRAANRWARWLARPCWHLFRVKPMPDRTFPNTIAMPLVSIEGSSEIMNQ